MILLIDNYDSFTYNLADLIQRQAGVDVLKVIRNDEVELEEALSWNLSGLVISPGPGTPDQTGISRGLIQARYTQIPVLGICLGHQLIWEMFGGKVVRAKAPMHGKTTDINHKNEGLFQGLPNPLKVMRYHSLIADAEMIPDQLAVTASSPEGEIMALKHKIHNLAAVQFHPESILTEAGDQLIANWLKIELDSVKQGA